MGARLILRRALKNEVADFVGRAGYERADGGSVVIYRNGFVALEGAHDQWRGGDRAATGAKRPPGRLESQVLGKGVARTHALEARVILQLCGLVGARR